MTDRIFVNEDRTVLVTLNDKTATVATRETPGQTWGPPEYLEEETNVWVRETIPPPRPVRPGTDR